MKYYRGYDLVVAKEFTIQTAILTFTVEDALTSLQSNGLLTIRKWYPWDGNSAPWCLRPFLNTKNSLEGSCGHDVLCDYINMGWLPRYLQPLVDQEYYEICRRHGMWWRLARWRLLAIRWYMTGKGAKRFTREVYEA